MYKSGGGGAAKYKSRGEYYPRKSGRGGYHS